MNLEKMQLLTKINVFDTLNLMFESSPEDKLHALFQLMESKVFNSEFLTSDQQQDGTNSEPKVMPRVLD
jgi:hypothetical protein